MKLKTTLQTVIFVVTVFCIASTSWSHKVRIFAWETGEGTISTEAKFSGGRPAQKAKVQVIDQKTGQELTSGATNEEGLYTFPIPENSSGELQIIVEAGDGHKNIWNHTLSTAEAPKEQAVETATASPEVSAPKADEPTASTSPQQPAYNQEELVKLIETSLDKKLAPIRKTLAENSDKGPSLQDIIGGIGYIFGLAGMAAYTQARRKNREKK